MFGFFKVKKTKYWFIKDTNCQNFIIGRKFVEILVF